MRKNAMEIQKLTPEEKQAVKIIAVMNNKGGCGKTSTCLGTGLYTVRTHNKNVLFIDLDTQSNLTQRLGLEEGQKPTERLDTFFREAKRSQRNMVLLPKYCHLRSNTPGGGCGQIGLLAGSHSSESEAKHLAVSFTGQTSRETKNRTGYVSINEFFKDKIEYYKNFFHYIILDTAPSIEGNILNTLALQIADEIIIPIDGVEAAWGIRTLLSWMDDGTQNLIKKPNGFFVMIKYSQDTSAVDSALQLVDKRTRNTVFSIMKKYFPEFVCDNGVRELKSIRHSIPGFGSKTEYNALSKEILERITQTRNNLLELAIDEELLSSYEKELSKIILKSRIRKPIWKYPYFGAQQEVEVNE